MSSEVVDAIVSGAGPSGLSAAIHLKKNGMTVKVVDKAKFPRDKICGDGLTTLTLRQFEKLGFDPRTLSSWAEVRDAIFCSPAKNKTHLSVEDGDGVRIGVVRRKELDSAFVDFARAQGVDIVEETQIEAVAQLNDSLQITLSDGETLRASYAIGADGMWAPLRHLVDATKHQPTSSATKQSKTKKRYLGDIHAFRQYFKVTGRAKDELWVWFEPDLLPGYVWSFPVGGGYANVGFGIERAPDESVAWMKDAWSDILKRPHIAEILGDFEPDGTHRAWPIPARIRTSLLSDMGGRVLYVGDAARVVDPLTGEGIGQALETGHQCAEAICAAGIKQPEKAALSYSRTISRGMKIDNSFARAIARLVTHPKPADWAIRLAPKGPWKGRYAFKWAFEDNPRAGLLTPWRYRDRFKNKTGAFVDK